MRIASILLTTLPNVAFQTPYGGKLLLTQNDSPTPQTFSVRQQGQVFTTPLPAGAAGT